MNKLIVAFETLDIVIPDGCTVGTTTLTCPIPDMDKAAIRLISIPRDIVYVKVDNAQTVSARRNIKKGNLTVRCQVTYYDADKELADTMRENDRLREGLKWVVECPTQAAFDNATLLLHPNKDS